jgi:hypothetical protein
VGIVALLHAAQKVHLEAFGVDGGLGLHLLALEGGVHLLQEPQHGFVQMLDVGEEAHALTGVPQLIHLLHAKNAIQQVNPFKSTT